MSSMDAKQIKKDIRAAIKAFGEYNFFDKGLYETMDTDKYKRAFIEMGAEKTASVLLEVLHSDKKYGEHFVQSLLCDLDDQPSDQTHQTNLFWDVLMAYPELEELY